MEEGFCCSVAREALFSFSPIVRSGHLILKKLITVSETHSELYMENEILKNNVHELEKQLNEARKKVVDKLA